MTPKREWELPETDGELVQRSRRGEQEAFEVLVRRHVGRAHALACSILGDQDEADDICQEAFLSALKRLDQLRDPSRFRGWLLRIVRNLSLNFLKRQGRAVDLPLMLLEGMPGGEDPDESFRERRVEEELKAAAEKLSGLPKKVFLLHELEGMEHREIAQVLGISAGASRVHLFLARKMLRSKIPRPSMEEAV